MSRHRYEPRHARRRSRPGPSTHRAATTSEGQLLGLVGLLGASAATAAWWLAR